MPSIKKNFLYSSILTTANYVFPFLTYPYVSRVLGVSNIGICNFVDSIINYFLLLSAMGIGVVGIREIAKSKNDRKKMSCVFSSLVTLNFIFTLIMILVLLLTIQLVPKFHDYKDLLYVGVFKLLGNFLLIEWLYKGLEEFKYITKRTILIKCVYVVCVFLLIKEKEDYNIYYILMTLMIVANCVFNCIHSRHFVDFSFSGIDIRPYVTPMLILGFYTILTSMYTSFNVAFLGFQGGDTEVGYYTTATKTYSIIMAIFTAFTGVMLPRMSSLLSEGKLDKYKELLNKSVNILLYFSIPVIILSEFYAPEIVNIISGKGFEGAIIPMRIVMPLIFLIGYEQIIIIQGLMPLKKDKAITINSCFGAVSGILLNILLVPNFYSIGSAWVWVGSEFVVTLSALYFVKKYVGVYFPFRQVVKNILYYIPLISLLVLLHYFDLEGLLKFVFASVLSIFYFMLLHTFFIKEPVVMAMIHRLVHKTEKMSV